MTFIMPSILFGLFLVAAAVFTMRILPSHQDLWRSLPRERKVGILLALIAMAWSAFEVNLMLEGSLAKLRPLLVPIVIVTTLLSYFLLDYLFTRALGGLLLLISSLLLHQAFSVFAPSRWMYALVCYVVAVAGMFMIGSPYRFRDWLEKVTVNRQWRLASATALAVGGVILMVVAVVHVVQTGGNG